MDWNGNGKFDPVDIGITIAAGKKDEPAPTEEPEAVCTCEAQPNEAGEVANEDLFASIISQFRGKVLLVDFWATWCGPCRNANKAMAPMKEELKDKDIVYVYITGETSPKGTWENMIPDIHGEHFRVTDKQWAYLGNAMGIEGVPTYFVIDREGDIKYKSVGFPGVAKMKEELVKVLDEK